MTASEVAEPRTFGYGGAGTAGASALRWSPDRGEVLQDHDSRRACCHIDAKSTQCCCNSVAIARGGGPPL